MAEVKTTGVPAEKPAASAIPASTTASATRTAPGLTFRRLFTKPGVSPYDEIEWEKRIAQITDSKGGVIFEQKDVEAPKDWSMTATNIVASKYLHGTLGTPERESGVRALVTRVAETIRDWGLAQGYFRTPEGMLFKWGSGTGTNLSPLRSSTEGLSGGGTASGPLSFMKGFDAFAGVIKSGGKTRRAAKMVILNVDHPDIEEFILCKQKEEAKAHALVAQGYDGSHPDPAAYSSIFFQNANNTVRVTH